MTPFRRRKVSTEPKKPPTPSKEAQKAYADSQARLSKTSQRWPDILDLVGSLQEVREQNNFEPRIKAALTGGE